MSGTEILTGATIAFDLDGTLVDTAPDLIGTLNHILIEEGLPPLPFEAARPFIGHGARRLLEKGLHAQGQALEEKRLDGLLVRFIDHYSQHSSDLSRPFPGVVEALTSLKVAGARLSVCTNKLTGLSVPILDSLGLSPFFDSVIGADLAPAHQSGRDRWRPDRSRYHGRRRLHRRRRRPRRRGPPDPGRLRLYGNSSSRPQARPPPRSL